MEHPLYLQTKLEGDVIFPFERLVAIELKNEYLSVWLQKDEASNKIRPYELEINNDLEEFLNYCYNLDQFISCVSKDDSNLLIRKKYIRKVDKNLTNKNCNETYITMIFGNFFIVKDNVKEVFNFLIGDPHD